MSKDKKQSSDKNKDKEELDYNGNPIDPKREYIGNKVKIPMASPNSSIYKTSSIIILRGKRNNDKQKKGSKLLEFFKRAPISFDKGDES